MLVIQGTLQYGRVLVVEAGNSVTLGNSGNGQTHNTTYRQLVLMEHSWTTAAAGQVWCVASIGMIDAGLHSIRLSLCSTLTITG